MERQRQSLEAAAALNSLEGMNVKKGRLTRGDLVRVRAAGTSDDWCPADVLLVGGDGAEQSVMLGLGGMVRAAGFGFVGGALPLTINYETGTVASLMGDEYEIEVRSEQATYADPGPV